MKSYRMLVALGAALFVAPAMFGQTDSTSPQTQPQQSTKPDASGSQDSMGKDDMDSMKKGDKDSMKGDMDSGKKGDMDSMRMKKSGMGGSSMKDKMFLKKAAQGGMAEVKLGQLASEKGSSDEVKSFGQKMVTDHTALNEEMKPVCDAMGVMPPAGLSKMDQAEYDKLNGMSGAAFDKEYLRYMVKDHRSDMREFKAEIASTHDATLKATVQKGEKVISEHTMMVTKLAQEKGAGSMAKKSSM